LHKHFQLFKSPFVASPNNLLLKALDCYYRWL